MLDDEVRAVLRVLKRIMQQERLTLQGMARRLGFSTGHLSMVFAGKRRPGIRFLRAAMARYPEVRRIVHAQFEQPPEARPRNAPRLSDEGNQKASKG